MISVITGDIIKSRAAQSEDVWLTPLKAALSNISNDTSFYDIYRGDSFQLESHTIEDSFRTSIYIKAFLKSIKGIDVRMSIGIGKKDYEGKSVSESNGEAFIFSGETFDTLKKEKQNLKIKTSNDTLNEELNLYFRLALIAMDNWTVNSAEIVKLSLEFPTMIQSELAKLIGISQDAVSKRQKRAYLDEILDLDTLYRKKIASLI
ncbi:HMG-box domain-containing protein [Winogradskyella bathintestinalis]|uniref:Transcriptional regulator n=1 Tax=Winogradskyella bathintestinalis TaxID=3035208 RepID=A0ABT7ZTF7_9FLAO|nr:transcriptional regulator [Winogradskyella bathintestinalis]MDN3492288.1 transcriptional regulator [Winogradskyella bathintestinalis]